MDTAVELLTATELTVKVALVLPLGTVTLAGTVATELLLPVRVTTAPPAGAGPLSKTVPCEVVPPVTLAGLKVNVPTADGKTARVAALVEPP
jgi:hypothetical protein